MRNWSVCAILALVGLMVGCGFSSKGFVITINEEQIQKQVDSQFPVKKNYLIANVAVTDPKVQLRGQDERIHIGVNLEVSVPTQRPQTGSATLSGKVEYEPQTAEFFLTDAKVESLETSAISEAARDQVKEVLGVVTKEVLNRTPIYKLQESDRMESMARLFLKEVKVADKRLELTMGLRETTQEN